jgi:hypothetical protein
MVGRRVVSKKRLESDAVTCSGWQCAREACVCGLEVMLRVGAVPLLVSAKMGLRFGRGRLRCDAVSCSVNGKVGLRFGFHQHSARQIANPGTRVL